MRAGPLRAIACGGTPAADAPCGECEIADRCSNGPHIYYPNPAGPGGTGSKEDWVMDSFGFDPYAWLEKIPLERVRQLHVAGHEPWETYGMLVDTHGADVPDPVIEMMAWVIDRVRLKPATARARSIVPGEPETKVLSAR